MKKYLLLTLILSSTLIFASEKTVFTYLNLAEARSISKIKEKPILIKFHADWCHNCTKMDQTTFVDPKVQSELENYISIKIDVNTREGQQIAQTFGISAIPVVAVINPSGNEIFRAVGYQSPKVLASKLSQLSRE